jgi:hypothetical protein
MVRKRVGDWKLSWRFALAGLRQRARHPSCSNRHYGRTIRRTARIDCSRAGT